MLIGGLLLIVKGATGWYRFTYESSRWRRFVSTHSERWHRVIDACEEMQLGFLLVVASLVGIAVFAWA